MSSAPAGARDATRRVREGMDHLQTGISPFVAARMKGARGTDWQRYASRASGIQGEGLDVYALLKTMLDNWRDVFEKAFPDRERQKARNFASVSLDARNAVSHLTLPLASDEALRYLDAMHGLLRATKGPDAEVKALHALWQEQGRAGFGAPPPAVLTVPGPISASPAMPTPGVSEGPSPSAAPSSAPSGRLRPWHEVALPHPDVIANRFQQAEFAADLFAVDAGRASETYARPAEFFNATYLTEGLSRVLEGALRRLANAGGEPVIGLQTSFGGGKTHTMLALYHLACHMRAGAAPDALPGLAPIVARVGAATWPKPQVAVFVGTASGPDISIDTRGGPLVRTPWGYLAWKLAGDAGLAMVAEAEAAGTNPGSDALATLFRAAGPCIILLDELVAYARQLPDERFEAFLSFAQSLTEAAKMSPGVLVVGSLPESDMEAGGARGVQALRRLQAVFGRVHLTWLPASGDETYEIIIRRLFQALDADGERARDETSRAFHELYRKNASDFPPEAKEARYIALLRLSYPIHPDLFDRLSKDWASLEKFQRTRGVLRFMANVIGVLWHERTQDPLITPARIPVAHEKVRASILYPLDAAFAAVVDKEVDGPGALPAQIEANPSRRISAARAATRVARAVFICSAPSVGQPNVGVTLPGLRLACAEPGDQLAVFAEALRELSQRATYLYEEAGRSWFSTQPTLNRLADERAAALPAHDVDSAIVKTLQEDASTKGGFHRVFAAPDDPVTVDEAEALALLILGPATTHTGRGASTSLATTAVTEALTRCRGSQRTFRNTMIFVAADEAGLNNARDVVRKSLAWAGIAADRRLRDQMTTGQVRDVEEKAKSFGTSARNAVRSAWSHVLYPVRSDVAGKSFALEHAPISARDRGAVPVTVWEKVRGDGIASERLGGENLWLALESVWPADSPHLAVREVAEWFSKFVYLPRIRDRTVLEAAIRDAVGRLDPRFGFADAVEADGLTYRGLCWGKPPPEMFSSTALLVRAAEAVAQLGREATPSPPPAGVLALAPSRSSAHPDAPPGSASPKPQKMRRFYGSVDIDPDGRPVKAFESIISAVVVELQRTQGARVSLTLEVSAEAPDGFDEADVSVVRDNSRQLKFRPDSTGFDS
jgi:predicted AAA+ superfamily ATPase